MPNSTGYGGGVAIAERFSPDGNLRGAVVSLAGPLAERRIRLVEDWDTTAITRIGVSSKSDVCLTDDLPRTLAENRPSFSFSDQRCGRRFSK